MFTLLDRIDGEIETLPGQRRHLLLCDERSTVQMAAEPELSAFRALVRVLNANASLAAHEALKEVVMTDVCPYSLGTQVMRQQADGSLRAGYCSVLIERNAPLPVSCEESDVTSRDDQTEVAVDVYQGEARRVADNLLLGKLTVPVPARPAPPVRWRWTCASPTTPAAFWKCRCNCPAVA